VYTPVAKRRHGYYVLPVLFGDRLVGRIEPVLEHATGELRIAGAWLERGFDVAEPGFGAAFAEALAAYGEMVGAKRTTFGRSRTCRLLARARQETLKTARPAPVTP